MEAGQVKNLLFSEYIPIKISIIFIDFPHFRCVIFVVMNKKIVVAKDKGLIVTCVTGI